MCGRYALDCSGDQLFDRMSNCHLEITTSKSALDGHKASYNVAPTQSAPVYTATHDLKYMKWGLIPHWAHEVTQAQQYKTFNARMENLASSKMWISPCNYTRCVVPIAGYYEWQTKGKSKIPYYITRKDRQIMFLAGMYDCLKSQDFYSYAIITSPAPPNMEWVHFRMPVVLEPGTKEWNTWLNPSKKEWSKNELKETLSARCDENVLEWWQVNSDVGKVTNDGAYLIDPIKNEVCNFFKISEKSKLSSNSSTKGNECEKKMQANSHAGCSPSSVKREKSPSHLENGYPTEKKEAKFSPKEMENVLSESPGKPKRRSIQDMLRNSSKKKQKLK